MSVASAELFRPAKQVERVIPTWNEATSELLGTYSLSLAKTIERIDNGQNPEVTGSFSLTVASIILRTPDQELHQESIWHATADAMRKPLGAFGLHLGKNEKDGNIPWETELNLVNDTTKLLAQRALINTARMIATHESSELRFAYNDAQKLMQRGRYDEATLLLSQAISPLIAAGDESPDRSNLQIDWMSNTHPERAQFTQKGRDAVEELTRLNSLSLSERVIKLAMEPYLGRVLAKMDHEMAANFPDWIFAQQIVNVAGHAADTHALHITGGRGRAQRFVHHHRPSGIENPRPPKPPGKRELILLGGTLVILGTILAACVAQDDDNPQPEPSLPPTTPTLNAGELPTVAATFAADSTPGSKLEATATPHYRATVVSLIGSLPADISGEFVSSNVQDEVDRIAQGNPSLAAKLITDYANLRHAAFGDPDDLMALPENVRPFGISFKDGLANSQVGSQINDNQIAFEVTGGNGTPEELPVGSMLFWSNGNELQTDLSPEAARQFVLVARPLPGGSLDLRIHNNNYTIVRLDSAGNVVHYLNEARVWVDQTGNPVAEITNTPGATPSPQPTATPTAELTTTLDHTPTPQPSETPTLISAPQEVLDLLSSTGLTIAEAGVSIQQGEEYPAYFDAEGNMIAAWNEWSGKFEQTYFVKDTLYGETTFSIIPNQDNGIVNTEEEINSYLSTALAGHPLGVPAVTDYTDNQYPKFTFNLSNIMVESYSFDDVKITNQELNKNVRFLKLKVTGLGQDNNRMNGTVVMLAFADYDGTGDRQIDSFTPDDLRRVKSIGFYFIPAEIGVDTYNGKLKNYPHYLPAWKLATYSWDTLNPDDVNGLFENNFEIGFGAPVIPASLFFTNRQD